MRLQRWITSSFRVAPQLGTRQSCLVEQLENRTMLSATVSSYESTPMAPLSASALNVSGTAKKWHTLTIDFAGPTAKQTDTSPNPFKDFRLQVRFTGPSGKTYNVPGYFDGDGKGGSTGNIWRVKFTPDERGTWNYQASFRKGTNVAIDLNASAGTATHFDGAKGSFSVSDRDPNAPGVLKWGRLEYVGGHYLKYRDGGYYLKTGSNEPENLLGYYGFVNTPNFKHRYQAHERDWKTGDPDWDGGKGKGIIGLINYFHNHNLNGIYFMPMNIGGQGKDSWPFAGKIDPNGHPSNSNLNYDLKKLQQWEVVFQHIQNKGMKMHIVFGETEEMNKRELDDTKLGTERKLFYREMIARIGHHNSIQWNVMEEYNWRFPLPASLMKEYAAYIKAIDPYKHPVTVHHTHNPNVGWTPFLGDKLFDSTSFQFYGKPDDPTRVARYGLDVEEWRVKTTNAGRPLPISIDETRAVTPTNMESQRKALLYATLFSGGHIEWIVDKYAWTENFRNYDDIYKWSGYARRFMEQNLPFWEMKPADYLLTGENGDWGGGQVFAKSNHVYAIYQPNASNTGTLDLSGTSGTFTQRWFNPRSGQFEGSSRTIEGGKKVAMGAPPSSSSNDWVILVTKGYTPPNQPSSPAPAPSPSPSPTPSTLTVNSITLINADTNKPISGFENIPNGATLDFAKLPTRNLNFEAKVSSSTKSVRFQLNSTVTIENVAPFAMFGDSGTGDYYAWRASTGDYKLTVTPYSQTKATGDAGTARVISFKIIDTRNPQPASPTPAPTPSMKVESFSLINADTNKVISGYSNLTNGMSIQLSSLPTRNLNIVANTSGTMRSVVFRLNSTYKTENAAPWALFSDRNGDYYAWRPSTGTYTLTATPWSEKDGKGTAGTGKTISFQFV